MSEVNLFQEAEIYLVSLPVAVQLLAKSFVLLEQWHVVTKCFNIHSARNNLSETDKPSSVDAWMFVDNQMITVTCASYR